MAAKHEIFTDAGGQYRFRLKAANGEIIATSQGYTTKDNTKIGIRSVMDNANAVIEDITGEA